MNIFVRYNSEKGESRESAQEEASKLGEATHLQIYAVDVGGDLTTELKIYSVVEIPIDPRVFTIKMEKTELQRFCKEQNLPLFSLEVEQTLLGPARIPSEVKRPYVKYFTPFQGTQIVATEYTDSGDKQEEAVP